jgi:hypothetical protein
MSIPFASLFTSGTAAVRPRAAHVFIEITGCVRVRGITFACKSVSSDLIRFRHIPYLLGVVPLNLDRPAANLSHTIGTSGLARWGVDAAVKDTIPLISQRFGRGATFLAAVYTNESSPQRRAKGTKNGCTSDTQCA